MVDLLESINTFLWGVPVLLLIVVVGLYLSIRSGFAQFRLLPRAFCRLLQSVRTDHGSGYRALCTALAATVGTGNLAGVAGAIAVGGPGVVFWMWICGFLGMIIKLSEVILAVNYRKQNDKGEYIGGPMHVINRTFPSRWRYLATLYSFFGVIAAFGIGNATQINTVMDSFLNSADLTVYHENIKTRILLGLVLSVLVFCILKRGTGCIGSIAESLVPFAAGIYILLSVLAVIMCADRLPGAIRAIIVGAFSPRSVTGGVLFSAFQTIRIGASRGVFTNEAGMGTASIAHAGSETEDPVEQGLLGVIEVFLDTIVICSLTALVILCSDITVEYGKDISIALTLRAFAAVYGDWVTIVMSGIICILAFATILGWSFYGARCAEFIWGDSAWGVFTVFQSLIVIVASVMGTGTVWILSEIVNGLMAIPNLIMLLWLSPQCIHMIRAYCCKEKAYRLF